MKTSVAQVLSNWFRRRFSNPEAVALLLTLIVAVLLLEFLGGYVMPALVSVVLAYLLMPLVSGLERMRCPHWLAVLVVGVIFVGVFIVAIFALVPFVWRQLTGLVAYLPEAIQHSQGWFQQLAAHYPKFLPPDPVGAITTYLQDEASRLGKVVLQWSLSSLSDLIKVAMYLVLVPVLVVLCLNEKDSLIRSLSQYLPKERGLLLSVWSDINDQFAAYIRARVLEIIIVALLAFILLWCFSFKYALVVALFVGLSVLIPYVGAIAAAIPVIVLGAVQYGLSSEYVYLLIGYVILGVFDGYVLGPLLFSGILSISPVVVIVSVLLFGGIWGFWGVFFAIPLALVIRTLVVSWPKDEAVSG